MICITGLTRSITDEALPCSASTMSDSVLQRGLYHESGYHNCSGSNVVTSSSHQCESRLELYAISLDAVMVVPSYSRRQPLRERSNAQYHELHISTVFRETPVSERVDETRVYLILETATAGCASFDISSFFQLMPRCIRSLRDHSSIATV